MHDRRALAGRRDADRDGVAARAQGGHSPCLDDQTIRRVHICGVKGMAAGTRGRADGPCSAGPEASAARGSFDRPPPRTPAQERSTAGDGDPGILRAKKTAVGRNQVLADVQRFLGAHTAVPTDTVQVAGPEPGKAFVIRFSGGPSEAARRYTGRRRAPAVAHPQLRVRHA